MSRFALSVVALLTLASCGDSAGAPFSAAETAPRGPVSRSASSVLAFVEGGRPHVILEAEPDLANVAGAAHVRSLEDPVVVERAVGSTGPAAAAWLGRRVRLHGASGPVCEGVVRSAVLLGRVSPHDQTLARLRGTSEDEAPLSAAEAADEAWSVAAGASGGVVLAGEVDAVGCEGAIWAGPADVEAPATFAVTTAEPGDEASYLARFRALPGWGVAQARYDDEARDERAARWDSHGDSSPTVNVIDLGPTRLVVVTADVGAGCGDFQGAMTAVFHEAASGVRLVGAPSDSAYVPVGAADVDGDGAVDLVLPNGLRRSSEGAFDDLESVEVPFLGCPC